ncbi:hypothetical protein [Massilia sp. YMA4]|uniref:hypothetical protein n=1 Tax=Massilia sp. YMA4 TaxID=1593482 RepID=UPI000DD12EBB|nr:hypothetical protein [Massilia sp. YMA4]AXA93589.1 hypothetical protein DPH57_22045 [Massilia sp. YMA4]
MAQTSSAPFSIRIEPAGRDIVKFRLSSASGGTDLPFALGQAFRQGHVPAGSSLAANVGSVQVTPKNTWPDGSLKFAIVAGRATLAAGSELTITLRQAPAASSVGLTTAALRGTGVTASIGAGSYGSASWADGDWDTPLRRWIEGPQMSSWIYRKPVGSDPHLVAWLEVRLFAGGAVEVLPWIENGYINLPGQSNRNAQFTFALNGSQRFAATIDLPHHCRTVLVADSTFSYWSGAGGDVIASHDKAYLQSTGLVPAYRARVPSNAPLWNTLAQTYTPLQRGNYAPAMGQGGYQSAIGILPEWDVLYLASDDRRALPGLIVNAYSAGRYPIHYRDEGTQQPLRFSAYPNLVVNGASAIDNSGASSKNQYTPVPSGTVPPSWDSPHHPSIGFFPYLLTGRFYFLEQVQFAATANYLKNTDQTRQFSAGVFLTNAGANTTRGAAWALRTLGQAWTVTPDGDPLQAEFLASVAANVAYYHGQYVAKPNNPQGFVWPYSSYTGGFWSEATWMQDFFTACTGYLIDLAPPLPGAGTTQLAAFFAWKARSIVGRFGGTAPTDYLFSDAAQYTIAVAPSDRADFAGGTGPWYANWGEVYQATLGKPNPGVAGPLRGAYYPEPTSYWANLQPALAYAVQHNVPGAREAYGRMTGAPNWNDFVNAVNNAPVWSVMPRPT